MIGSSFGSSVLYSRYASGLSELLQSNTYHWKLHNSRLEEMGYIFSPAVWYTANCWFK